MATLIGFGVQAAAQRPPSGIGELQKQKTELQGRALTAFCRRRRRRQHSTSSKRTIDLRVNALLLAAWTARMATVRGKSGAWDHFYKTARWQRLRKLQLAREPLCKFCREIVTLATVAYHVVPHKGDVNKFWLGELQLLCESCHRSGKQ